MPHIPEDNDTNSWHRYFAMECNNRAWQLAVQSRTGEEDLEMLNAAHAAALHWQVIGTEMNTMRATILLAEVQALLGFGVSAFRYAEDMRHYFLDGDTPDWEIAFTHAIHAHAAAVAGEVDHHRASYHAARQAIDAIVDDEDRAIVLQTFDQVPAP